MSQSLSQLQAVGIPLSVGLSALGQDIQHIREGLTTPDNTLTLEAGFLADRAVWVGRYAEALIETVPESLSRFDSRNLRFALTALQKIETELQQQIASIDSKRLSIVMGTSTSGISDSELLLKQYYASTARNGLPSQRFTNLSRLARGGLYHFDGLFFQRQGLCRRTTFNSGRFS